MRRPLPPASSSNCLHRPHGTSGAPSAATTLTPTSRPAPAACNALTRPHSAHRVRPNDAFSTLHPVTTAPLVACPAAPTRSREYGAYALPAAAVAAARKASQSMVMG